MDPAWRVHHLSDVCRFRRYNRHQRAVWELINICRDLDLGVFCKAPIPSNPPTTKRGDLLVLGLVRAPLVVDVTTLDYYHPF